MIKELEANASGFQPLFQNDHFMCAFITHSDKYSYGTVSVVKRHLGSQEVFLLLKGTASVFVADPEWKSSWVVSLHPGRAYCIEAGVWHYLAISDDALLFVTENNDVNAENTDTLYLEEPYEIRGGLSTPE